jgi:hypothetical protein
MRPSRWRSRGRPPIVGVLPAAGESGGDMVASGGVSRGVE